jgi:hypothetical protein
MILSIQDVSAQYRAELAQAKEWIANGSQLEENMYPDFFQISQNIIENKFEESIITNKDDLIHTIGEETNSIYNGFVDDTFENRCNYAKTLFELYRNKIL